MAAGKPTSREHKFVARLFFAIGAGFVLYGILCGDWIKGAVIGVTGIINIAISVRHWRSALQLEGIESHAAEIQDSAESPDSG